MVNLFKLLAIEGIDGAGKRTQIELLAKLLGERRVRHARFSFPRYESFFGKMVGRYLNGEFGAMAAVDPHFSALLFAGDRLEARGELWAALEKGKVVLADRYIASNLAHQGARVPAGHRKEFLEWLARLEYKVYGLPAESLVVYLRLPAAAAQVLVEKKSTRNYTRLRKDIQEADLAHLEEAARVYDTLAKQTNWVTVECFDGAKQEMRAPAAIHAEVVAAMEKKASYLVKRRK